MTFVSCDTSMLIFQNMEPQFITPYLSSIIGNDQESEPEINNLDFFLGEQTACQTMF